MFYSFIAREVGVILVDYIFIEFNWQIKLDQN